jgi:hypothetical protein
MEAIEKWAGGELSMTDVARETLDPLIVRTTGEKLGPWIFQLFEGRLDPDARSPRKAAEVAIATRRLEHLAEWLSAGALDSPGRRT